MTTERRLCPARVGPIACVSISICDVIAFAAIIHHNVYASSHMCTLRTPSHGRFVCPDRTLALATLAHDRKHSTATILWNPHGRFVIFLQIYLLLPSSAQITSLPNCTTCSSPTHTRSSALTLEPAHMECCPLFSCSCSLSKLSHSTIGAKEKRFSLLNWSDTSEGTIPWNTNFSVAVATTAGREKRKNAHHFGWRSAWINVSSFIHQFIFFAFRRFIDIALKRDRSTFSLQFRLRIIFVCFVYATFITRNFQSREQAKETR